MALVGDLFEIEMLESTNGRGYLQPQILIFRSNKFLICYVFILLDNSIKGTGKLILFVLYFKNKNNYSRNERIDNLLHY